MIYPVTVFLNSFLICASIFNNGPNGLLCPWVSHVLQGWPMARNDKAPERGCCHGKAVHWAAALAGGVFP